MIIARQSTARIVMVGPVLDADGVAVTNGVVGDFKISKNGGVPAALNGSATLTHRHTGFYSLSLTASDLDTVGQAEVVIDDTVNACPTKEITVIEEAAYDAVFAASAVGYAATAPVTIAAVNNGVNGMIRSGTAQSVSATGLVMDSGASFADDVLIGKTITLTSGTHIGTTAIVTDNTGSTDTLVMSGGWSGGVTPTGTPTFEISGTAQGASLTDIAGAVWDLDATAHQTQGTFGQAIGDPASDSDTIWALVNTNLNATVSSRASQTSVDTIDDFLDTEIAAIKTKTDFLPSATAGSAGGVFIAGTNAATTITTGLTTTFTGNLTGSVGSVAAGGITAASIATDAIDADAIAADAVTEIQSGLATQASVNTIDDFLDTEVAAILAAVDTEVSAILALLDDARAEPGQGAPAASADIVTKIDYLYKWTRNKKDNDGSVTKFYADDGTTVDHKQTTSESAGTVTKGEIVTGP
jgi:hypothetical protein